MILNITYMSSLCNSNAIAEATVYLAHVDYPCDSHNFQIAIIVSRFIKLVLSFWAPGVGTRAPAVSETNIQSSS